MTPRHWRINAELSANRVRKPAAPRIFLYKSTSFLKMTRLFYMKQRQLRALREFMFSALAAVFLLSSSHGLNSARAADAKADLVPLKVQLPSPTAKGTPDDLPKGPNVEAFSDKPPPPFLAPKGVQNVALGKKISCSVEKLFTGTLSQITDGKKEPDDDSVVEMRKGVQWVQLDLEKAYPINAIVLWHDHRWLQVFHSVVVQAADDPEFTSNVRTIFNNDFANSAGRGAGTDKEYFETQFGKTIDAKGVQARYLRFYSRGSSMTAYNVYQEIEVYALPGQ